LPKLISIQLLKPINYEQGMSSSTNLCQQQDPFNSLLCDSQQIGSNCASCGNRILQTAKILQIQREFDQKINKVNI